MTQMQPSSESNYEIELRTDYVYMKIVGVYNSQQFMGLPEIILNECGKVKSEKILVDMLNVDFSNLSTMERYFLGEEFAKVISYHASVAAVVPEKVITKFLETVAINRGANIVVASDFSVAESWLINQ
jgi:hypothetical protein